MKQFALIGAAGFVAPRHLKAIKDTGNVLVAALDKNDSVGILDSYFPGTDFFTELERFDRHLEKLRREGRKVDYVSICSPNYHHDFHIRSALRQQADAICEKPMVLNPWNLDALETIEQESGKRVYTILQLRLHPSILALKEKIDSRPENHYEVSLNYVTSRGKWYDHSWKGDESKSGGILMNIGIHFFDVLLWLFGRPEGKVVAKVGTHTASGEMQLTRANVKWFLSIREEDLPAGVRQSSKRTFRSFRIGDSEIEFSDGFTDLHTRCYQDILSGKGYGIGDARLSIETVYNIRKSAERM